MAYQSFGSYGSFKFTPDLGRSRKILQARSEEREGEDRYLNQLQQQQRSYMEVMRQKLRDEQAQRDRNFQIEAGFRQQYQDAVNKNSETEINNLEIQRRQSAEFMKSLSDFSQTLGEKFEEIAEKKKEEKEAEELTATILKIRSYTPEQKNSAFRIQQVDEARLQASDSALKGIANDQASFIGNNKVENLRQSASGSFSVNERKMHLAYAGANLEEFGEINKDLKLTVYRDGKPVKLTLNEAKQEGGEILAQAYESLTLKAIEHFKIPKKELSAEFLVRNFFQPADAFTNRLLAKSEAERDERLGQIAELRESTDLRQKIFWGAVNASDPSSPYIISEIVTQIASEHKNKYVDANGKVDYAYIRDSVVLPEIKDMAESGAFKGKIGILQSFVNNQLLVLNESGKPVSLQSIKSSDSLDELNQTLRKLQREEDSNREREYTAAAIDDVNRLGAAALEDGVFTPTERHEIKKAMFAAHKHDLVTLQKVYDQLDNFGLDDSENLDRESEYLSMVAEGKNGDLTALRVQQNLNWLTKEQREELTNYVDAFNSEDPTKVGYKRSDIEKQAKSMFRSALSELDIGKGVDASVDLAATEVGDYYVEQYMKVLKASGDEGYAAEDARTTTMTYLTGGMKDPTNPFYVVTADKAKGTQGYIKGFRVGKYSVAQQTNTHQQLKDISQNPSLLSTNVYLSDRYLEDIADDIKNGRMIEYTPWVNQIASMTNQLPYEVINQQLQAAKIDQKIEPGAFDNLAEVASVDPKLKAMLAIPTAVRINTAIIGTNNVPGIVRSGAEGEQDVKQLTYRAGFKAPAVAAAMWKLDTANGNTSLGSNRLFKLSGQDDQQQYPSVFEAAKAATDFVNNIPGVQSATTYAEVAQAIATSAYPEDPQYASKLMSQLAEMGYRPDDQIRVHTGPQAVNPAFMSETLRRAYYRQLDSNQMASNTQSGFDTSKFNTMESYGGISLDRLRDAVIGKESSNIPSEVNPHSGAKGLGQVMDANIGPWSKEALGKSISKEEFLKSPELQMRIINHRFTKMMKEQSALGFSGEELIRRVASIWYSGKAELFNNTRPQTYGSGKYPSINRYTQDVADRYFNN